MTSTSHCATAPALPAPLPRPATTGLVATLMRFDSVWRQRRQLARLTAHRLNDIGLTSADVHQELDRPVWNAPGHWHR